MWINLSEAQMKWLRGAVADEEIVKVFDEAIAREKDPETTYYRELAPEQTMLPNEGIDIDEDAVVSFGDDGDGAYVMAWVWVEDDRTTCKDCGVKFEEGGDNDSADERCADCADKKAGEEEE
jgi:hypothetical protein